MAEKKRRFAYAAEPVQPEIPVEVQQPIEAVLDKDKLLAKQQKKQVLTTIPQMQKEAAFAQEQSSKQAKRSKSTVAGVKAIMSEQAKPQVLAKQQNYQPASLTLHLGNLEAMLAPPQRRGKVDVTGEGRMAIPREQLNVRITPDLKRAAGAVAALHGLTLGDIVEKALLEFITKENEQ